MPWALGLQPDLRDISAKELALLLEAAARANSAQEVAVLTSLPAAQQLQEEDVERILTGTKVRLRNGLLESVTALPAVQQLSGRAYLRVLRAGVQVSDIWRWQGLQVLLKLPAAQQLDAAALGELLAVAADKGTHALPHLTALPLAQQLQPDVVLGVLQQLVRGLAKKGSMGSLEVDAAFAPLLQLQPAQQIPLESLQQLFDAVTDLGPKGGNLPDLIRKLPQAAGLQERLSLKRLLPLLRQACGCTDRYSYMRTGIKPAEALRLLQEPAAQELSGSDLVELLKEATISASDSILAGLQALPGFTQLRSKDLLRLMRTAMIDSGSRRCIPLMESYADHPAAATVTEAELMGVLTTGLEHNSDVSEFFAALLRVPAGRQLDKEKVLRLVRTAIDKQCEAALLVLLASPGGQALDAAAALELVRDAGGLGPYAGGPGFKSVRRARIMVSAVLAGLPKAVAQFSRQQIQGLLFEALGPGADSLAPQPGADDVQIVLAKHFAARCSGQGAAADVEGEQEGGGAVSGASSGDAELAAMCGAMRLLEGRTYPFPHELL